MLISEIKAGKLWGWSEGAALAQPGLRFLPLGRGPVLLSQNGRGHTEGGEGGLTP